jgi:hypothetical protein
MENRGESSGAKAFFVTLGIGAAVGGFILVRKALAKNKIPAEQVKKLPEKSTKTGNDNFPLRYGSMGSRVRQLQEALKRILGEATLLNYTRVDGDFRSGTEGALKAAGLPVVVDEATFNRLTSGGTLLPEAFSPDKLATSLLSYARSKNFDGVMGILKQLKTTNDYSAVNEPFKAKQYGAALSIVTYLLDESFPDNTAAKEQIKAEFRRMGLKESAGKWSLSGIRLYRDIITLTSTFVKDAANRKIPVSRNTILGEEVSVSNGMTWFKDINQQIYSVPTRDVAYAK